MKAPAGIGLLLLLLFSPSLLALSYTLQISRAELQQQLDTMMPLQRPDRLLGVTITRAEVGFTADNKISLQADITTLALGSIQGQAQIRIAGRISYRPDEGAFYLQEIEVLDMQSRQLQAQYLPAVRTVSQQLLTEVLRHQPVYTLKDDDSRERLARATLKSVSVQEQQLQLAFSLF